MAKPELIERVSAADLPEASDLPILEMGQILLPQGKGTGVPTMSFGIVTDGADHAVLKHFPDGSVKGKIYGRTGKELKKFDRAATTMTVPVNTPPSVAPVAPTPSATPVAPAKA